MPELAHANSLVHLGRVAADNVHRAYGRHPVRQSSLSPPSAYVNSGGIRVTDREDHSAPSLAYSMVEPMTLPLASYPGSHPEPPPPHQRRDPGARQYQVCRYRENIRRSDLPRLNERSGKAVCGVSPSAPFARNIRAFFEYAMSGVSGFILPARSLTRADGCRSCRTGFRC